MQKSSFDKWLVTLAVLIVIAGAIFHFVHTARNAREEKQIQTSSSPDPFSDSYDFHPYYLPSVPRPTNGAPEPETGFEKLPREKVEAWLAKHNRDATSLLAAFRALDDTNYLNEAAANFPNNPQVELAVLTKDEFPADRRKWLDLFKASSPDNSLPNYLSAQDYLQNGNSDAAIRELLAATGKSQFDANVNGNRLRSEDLYSSSGDSPKQTATLAMADTSKEDLPELAAFKRLAQDIKDLQQQYVNSGDISSGVNLVQMGMQFGNQIESGDSGKFLINQLVGIAIKSMMLQQLDPNTSYDFLGGQTPGQVLRQLKEQKASFRKLVENFQAAYPQLTEQEMLTYFDQRETYSELYAMRWVVQQHPSSNP